MNKIYFTCKLLSDIIINQQAATEGSQQTLDFIPGNTFLGIAASSLYKKAKATDSFLLFHSGKVRFGDAYPVMNDQMAIHIPSSWYFKKNEDENSTLFVHHNIPEDGLKDENNNPVQIKQCREGYIIKDGAYTARKIEIDRNFAIKSAYDSKKRCSADKKMYGYQSVCAGSEWEFEIAIDDEAIPFRDELVKSLTGIKRVGRSRNAQYGLVEIEEIEKSSRIKFETFKQIKILGENKENIILIYALSRLIFFDKYGQPTFTPEENIISQLGLKTGAIDWSKSQLRTFKYSPYNNCRKSRDADRCGIEKGSVICITGASLNDIDKAKIEHGVGSYLNEGFGQVLINPEFLESKDEKGTAVFNLLKADEKSTKIVINKSATIPKIESKEDDCVYDYLKRQNKIKENQSKIYSCVNDFVKDNFSNYKGNSFSSQWGTIRSLAMQAKDIKWLCDKLFKSNKGYLVHGIAAERWEGTNEKKLNSFIKKLPADIAVEAVLNLSAEMAKKSKMEESK